MESPKDFYQEKNLEWTRKTQGWDCRQSYYVDGHRKRHWLGHLGRQRWLELQARYKGDALTAALANWVATKRAKARRE